MLSLLKFIGNKIFLNCNRSANSCIWVKCGVLVLLKILSNSTAPLEPYCIIPNINDETSAVAHPMFTAEITGSDCNTIICNGANFNKEPVILGLIRPIRYLSDTPDLADNDVAIPSKAPPAPPSPNRADDDVRPNGVPPNIGAASIVHPVAVIPTKAPPIALIPRHPSFAPYIPNTVLPNRAPPNMVLLKNPPPIAAPNPNLL